MTSGSRCKEKTTTGQLVKMGRVPTVMCVLTTIAFTIALDFFYALFTTFCLHQPTFGPRHSLMTPPADYVAGQQT
ncbi:hypothetical protein DPMN_169990 [Dreissena polymorpha]|uniref:Uncharacterized protein n=1 Tax=Dreissena polymorpha TaxID=45954 RepID=A0A9D4DWI8_DREPO|nr:hypothetical protein DPMN_169990 [Dreissena polymorpha]